MGNIDEYTCLEVQLPVNIELLYAQSWHDWSWGGFLIVYSQYGEFFALEDGEVPIKVSQEEALSMMLDFEVICSQYG